jgi:hypothetical protein
MKVRTPYPTILLVGCWPLVGWRSPLTFALINLVVKERREESQLSSTKIKLPKVSLRRTGSKWAGSGGGMDGLGSWRMALEYTHLPSINQWALGSDTWTIPPYCADLNPIQNCWAWLKQKTLPAVPLTHCSKLNFSGSNSHMGSASLGPYGHNSG